MPSLPSSLSSSSMSRADLHSHGFGFARPGCVQGEADVTAALRAWDGQPAGTRPGPATPDRIARTRARVAVRARITSCAAVTWRPRSRSSGARSCRRGSRAGCRSEIFGISSLPRSAVLDSSAASVERAGVGAVVAVVDDDAAAGAAAHMRSRGGFGLGFAAVLRQRRRYILDIDAPRGGARLGDDVHLSAGQARPAVAVVYRFGCFADVEACAREAFGQVWRSSRAALRASLDAP